MRQWIIIGTILCSLSTYGADFLIEVQPKTDSVGVQELKTELKPTCSSTQKMRYDGSQYICEDITSSSILNFASDVISAMSSTLSNYLLKTDIPVCSGSQVLTRTLGGYSCISPSAGSSLAAVTTKNASYSATTSDEVILVDLTTSSLTITLPTASLVFRNGNLTAERVR